MVMQVSNVNLGATYKFRAYKTPFHIRYIYQGILSRACFAIASSNSLAVPSVVVHEL